MNKITPFLWFDTQAEEAAKFYTSIFKKSKLGRVTRYGDGAPMPKGTVMTAPFTIEGLPFTALNGGPHYKTRPPSPSSSTASRRRKSTITGTGWSRAGSPCNAAG